MLTVRRRDLHHVPRHDIHHFVPTWWYRQQQLKTKLNWLTDNTVYPPKQEARKMTVQTLKISNQNPHEFSFELFMRLCCCCGVCFSLARDCCSAAGWWAGSCPADGHGVCRWIRDRWMRVWIDGWWYKVVFRVLRRMLMMQFLLVLMMLCGFWLLLWDLSTLAFRSREPSSCLISCMCRVFLYELGHSCFQSPMTLF